MESKDDDKARADQPGPSKRQRVALSTTATLPTLPGSGQTRGPFPEMMAKDAQLIVWRFLTARDLFHLASVGVEVPLSVWELLFDAFASIRSMGPVARAAVKLTMTDSAVYGRFLKHTVAQRACVFCAGPLLLAAAVLPHVPAPGDHCRDRDTCVLTRTLTDYCEFCFQHPGRRLAATTTRVHYQQATQRISPNRWYRQDVDHEQRCDETIQSSGWQVSPRNPDNDPDKQPVVDYYCACHHRFASTPFLPYAVDVWRPVTIDELDLLPAYSAITRADSVIPQIAPQRTACRLIVQHTLDPGRPTYPCASGHFYLCSCPCASCANNAGGSSSILCTHSSSIDVHHSSSTLATNAFTDPVDAVRAFLSPQPSVLPRPFYNLHSATGFLHGFAWIDRGPDAHPGDLDALLRAVPMYAEMEHERRCHAFHYLGLHDLALQPDLTFKSLEQQMLRDAASCRRAGEAKRLGPAPPQPPTEPPIDRCQCPSSSSSSASTSPHASTSGASTSSDDGHLCPFETNARGHYVPDAHDRDRQAVRDYKRQIATSPGARAKAAEDVWHAARSSRELAKGCGRGKGGKGLSMGGAQRCSPWRLVEGTAAESSMTTVPVASEALVRYLGDGSLLLGDLNEQSLRKAAAVHQDLDYLTAQVVGAGFLLKRVPDNRPILVRGFLIGQPRFTREYSVFVQRYLWCSRPADGDGAQFVTDQLI